MAVESLAPLAAFVAGLVAFFSPCILPVVPGFLGFVTGGSATSRAKRIIYTIAFVAGFTVAFTVIGFLIGAAGQSAAFIASEAWLRRIGGALIIAFGFWMLGLLPIPVLDRDLRYHGKVPAWLGPGGSAFVLGAAFGVGWTPCVGPVLASILILAGIEGSASMGGLLLLLFSLGLAVPFLVFGLVADRGAAWIHRNAKWTRVVEWVGGLFLIALGIAVFTGAANRLIAYLV